MVSDQDVLKALQSVPGPDGKTPLPGSGALSGLSIKDGKVYLSIAIDPRQSAALEPMRQKIGRCRQCARQSDR